MSVIKKSFGQGKCCCSCKNQKEIEYARKLFILHHLDEIFIEADVKHGWNSSVFDYKIETLDYPEVIIDKNNINQFYKGEYSSPEKFPSNIPKENNLLLVNDLDFIRKVFWVLSFETCIFVTCYNEDFKRHDLSKHRQENPLL